MTDLAAASAETLQFSVNTTEVPFETFSITVPERPMILNGEQYAIAVDEDRLRQALSYRDVLISEGRRTRLKGLDISFAREGLTGVHVDPGTDEVTDVPYHIPMGFDPKTNIIHCHTLEGQQDSTTSSEVIAQEVQDKLNAQVVEALLQNLGRTKTLENTTRRRYTALAIAPGLATITGLEIKDGVADSLLLGGIAGLGTFVLTAAGIIIGDKISQYRLKQKGINTGNPVYERAVRLAKSKKFSITYSKQQLSGLLPIVTVSPVPKVMADQEV